MYFLLYIGSLLTTLLPSLFSGLIVLILAEVATRSYIKYTERLLKIFSNWLEHSGSWNSVSASFLEESERMKYEVISALGKIIAMSVLSRHIFLLGEIQIALIRCILTKNTTRNQIDNIKVEIDKCRILLQNKLVLL